MEHEWHHVRPLYLGGEDTRVGVLGRNGVWLCPTAHTNVHEILRVMLGQQRELTWYEATELWEVPVNRYCYLTALTGFRWYVDGLWGAV